MPAGGAGTGAGTAPEGGSAGLGGTRVAPRSVLVETGDTGAGGADGEPVVATGAGTTAVEVVGAAGLDRAAELTAGGDPGGTGGRVAGGWVALGVVSRVGSPGGVTTDAIGGSVETVGGDDGAAVGGDGGETGARSAGGGGLSGSPDAADGGLAGAFAAAGGAAGINGAGGGGMASAGVVGDEAFFPSGAMPPAGTTGGIGRAADPPAGAGPLGSTEGIGGSPPSWVGVTDTDGRSSAPNGPGGAATVPVEDRDRSSPWAGWDEPVLVLRATVGGD